MALQDPSEAAREAERAVSELGFKPRKPLESQREIYRDRPELLGPTWAFGVETTTHALRLIVSGLFDRFPQLTVILGHLGEGAALPDVSVGAAPEAPSRRLAAAPPNRGVARGLLRHDQR